ncbi:ectonucleotide pyrophosphatase/phosphodiesterase [Mucilaginibacter sabulilitoris]|uniref:Ectonucleotide pyrophosphatase/phosphodiesterase n=1 Tax=Mucilaginibacter sabulilitoris TaxID=1173583 RepID=A0ABZ0TKB8_9SPHI|nr:ectonucleotide pyrophosphatase/phosphodiesterase [Mucilaginibacter sabulilitoris]WPU92628.1 ectonucleotide pyrophosphatase/phosphodiesterase [Mucilaginibacter sabulilitoris]
MKKHIAFWACLLYAASTFGQADTAQKIVTGRKNSIEQQKKSYVILISADGFRYDYAQKYQASHLLELSSAGVKATSMIPSYPSVTFPNHYALVSGLFPSHSGLVNNGFYDRDRRDSYFMGDKNKVADGSWYFGSPLWVLAEQQHLLSASFYWVASEAAIQGINPTYYYSYNEKIAIHNRINAVVNWLNLPAEERPHFITFYFPQVDHAGHVYGPDAPETAREVHFVDSAVNELTKAVKTTGLDVNFIFVADHGMTNVDKDHPIGIPAAIDTSKFIISGDGTLVELYAKNGADIQATYSNLKQRAKDYDVYLKTNMPAKLHYGQTDDWHNRIGDILLIPRHPKLFNLWNKKINPGWHGYDPSLVKDMHATFLAWGPVFKPHTVIQPFENVDVFNLVKSILGLSYTGKIDGTDKLAHAILVNYQNK